MFAAEIVDDQGRKIVLEQPAERIIALYGAYNEILAALGLESRIIARTKADTEPPSIRSKPSIGTHMRPNVEMIMSLKPDLIIQGAGRREAMTPVTQLIDLGFNVAVFNPTTFEELFSVMKRIGVLTGTTQRADRLLDSLQSRLDRVRKCVRHTEKRPSVFFEVRYPNLLAAGTESIVNDVIEHAGGKNAVPAAKKFARLNIEALIQADPDYYLVQRGPMNPNPQPLAERPHFDLLRFGERDRVLYVDEKAYSRPGPRAVEAVEELARFIHPRLRHSADCEFLTKE